LCYKCKPDAPAKSKKKNRVEGLRHKVDTYKEVVSHRLSIVIRLLVKQSFHPLENLVKLYM